MKNSATSKFINGSFCLIVVIAIIIASATIIEKHNGTEHVLKDIYLSNWFVALWALLSCTSFVSLILLWKRLKTSTKWLHISFFIILIGALTTHVTSQQGYMTLNDSSFQFQFIHNDSHLIKQLPFGIKIHKQGDTNIEVISNQNEGSYNISPNNPLNKDFYRLFLLSSDKNQHTANIFINYDPFGIGITYIGYLILFMSVGSILINRYRKFRMLNKWQKCVLVLIPTCSILYSLKWFITDEPTPVVLHTGWLVVHVSIIISSYLLFFILFIQGIIRLVGNKNLVNKYPDFIQSQHALLKTSVLLLCIGIFIGAMWANESWGTYWNWDPKEAWALVTLLLYTIPLHHKILPLFKSEKIFNIYLVVAFTAVLMTYIGVNYFLGGMHSYAN